MHPTLERLIRLQELDNATEEARRKLTEMPERAEGLQVRIAAREATLAAARQQLADNQAARREIEKELAVVQGRLSRFRDQIMEVKTNKEYQAMQKEMAVAERDVRSHEDRVLELMLQADELAGAARQGETELAEEKRAVAEAERALDQERRTLEAEIGKALETRGAVVRELDGKALSLFEHVARSRKGIAVVEARGGHCSFCHVRLRPQVFNDVRRNEELIQCESCQRILYFAGTPV